MLQQRAASALQGGTRALLLSLQQYGSSPAAAGSWKEAFTELLQGAKLRHAICIFLLLASI